MSDINKRGKFIVFEGIDGSGKSTQAKLLEEYLISRGEKCIFTLEPTYNRIGDFLHKILSGDEKADPRVIAALFAADRLEHVLNASDGIMKHLADGSFVICDRYYLSSFAYQGTEVPLEWVIALNSECRKVLKPDLTIFVDTAPEVSLKRIQDGRESFEIYENLSRLTSVRENYLSLIERFKNEENILSLDGCRDRDEIFEDIKKAVSYL